MNNGEYWKKRSEIREAKAYSNCLEATNGLVNAYDIQSRYGYSSAFATVNSKVVENALTYPWSGANFSDRLWKHKGRL